MKRAVVIGAGGGIGCALVDQLAASRRYETIFALSRHPAEHFEHSVSAGTIDVGDPQSIAAAADGIGGALDLVIVDGHAAR